MTIKKHVLLLFAIILLVSSFYNNSRVATAETLSWVGGLYDNIKYNKAVSIKYCDDYVYLSIKKGTDSLVIVDVSDRSNPVEVGNITVASDLRQGSLSSDGNWFFASSDDPDAIMYIFNCTDKTNPTVEGSIDLGGVEIQGAWYVESTEVVYVADYANKELTSIDVTDKTNPTELDSITAQGVKPHDVWANETVAVIVTYIGSTFETYDVTDPSNMIYRDSISSGAGNAAQVNGDSAPLIFVSNIAGSMNIFNISDPVDIVSVGSVTGLGIASTAKANPIDSNILFIESTLGPVGTYWVTISAYDISNPASPSLINSINGTNISYHWPTVTSMDTDGYYVYIAVQGSDATQGLGEGDGLTIFSYGDEPESTPDQLDFISIDGGANGTSITNTTTWKIYLDVLEF